MQLSEDQFARQLSYEASLRLAERMHESGLLKDDEYIALKDGLIAEYDPIVRH